jgi:hypothetical protein
MSDLEVKQTSQLTAGMSAYDPKRTSRHGAKSGIYIRLSIVVNRLNCEGNHAHQACASFRHRRDRLKYVRNRSGPILSNTSRKVVVPLPAGSAPDIRHRLIAQRLTQLWGQKVIVENRPGAGGLIGTQAALAGDSNGYTLLAALASIYTILPVQTRSFLSMSTATWSRSV